MSDLDSFSSDLVKKYAKPETAATAGVPLDDLSKGVVTEALHKVETSEETEHKGDVWKPDTPEGIESVDEPFYMLAAEAGIPYAVARATLAGAVRAGAPAVGKFLTGQVGKGVLRSLPSVATSGAWQGALAEGIDKLAGKAHDVSEAGAAGLGAVVNAIMHGVVSPFVNKIAPEVARRAQNYIAQGIPLRTYQIPGASAAATIAGRLKAYSKLLGMSDKDAPALTESLMKSGGSNAQLLNPTTLAQMRADIKDRVDQAIPGAGWKNIPDQHMQKAFDVALNGGGLFSDAEHQALLLAQNHFTNSNVLERIMANSGPDGLASPKAVMAALKSQAANYGGMSAGDAARAAGNPVDLNALADGAQHFAPQPFSAQKLASAAITGGGLLGFGELEGLPLIETLGHHPAATAAASTALGAVGGIQNTTGYTNWLLDRAAKDAGPLLAGSNPLIPAYLAARPQDANGLAALNPVGSANAATSGTQNDPVEGYIRKAAATRGIDPDVAVKVAKTEGLGGQYAGDSGSSFGPFQLHYGDIAKGQNAVSGLGDVFTKATGLHASDPATIPAQVDFALDYAAKNGWSPWHGWQGDQFAGIPKSGDTKRLAIPLTPANAPANYFTPGVQGAQSDNALSGSQ
jgi:hypothetical protein